MPAPSSKPAKASPISLPATASSRSTPRLAASATSALRGQENLCDDLIFNNGAYAEFIQIPERIVSKNTLVIPANVPLEHAALTEPLACAVHGLEDSGPRKGDTVAVIGGGPLGLMILHVAALAGFETISIVKHDGQVEAARQLGATHVVQAATIRKAFAKPAPSRPGDRGVDVAIEAVGTPETWQEAVELVRKGGTVNFFGGCAANTHVTLDTNRIHYSDITLRATFHHTPAICRKALELIAGGRFQAGAFITGHAHLYELNRVFEKLMNRSTKAKSKPPLCRSFLLLDRPRLQGAPHLDFEMWELQFLTPRSCIRGRLQSRRRPPQN